MSAYKKSITIFLAVLFFLSLSQTTLSPEEIALQKKVDKAYPQIVITKLKVLGGHGRIRSDSDIRKEVEFPDTVKLTWKDDFLMIEFDLVGSKLSDQNQYAYKIIGYHEKWINIGNKNFIILENLKSGKYEFKVKGSNSEGIWSEEPASLKLILIPAFWKTPIFKGIILFFTASLLVIVYLLLKRKYQAVPIDKINLEQITNKYNLTKREIEIFELLLRGDSINKMAQKLYISESTVQKHIYSVYKKLKIRNRMQLINTAQRFSKK